MIDPKTFNDTEYAQMGHKKCQGTNRNFIDSYSAEFPRRQLLYDNFPFERTMRDFSGFWPAIQYDSINISYDTRIMRILFIKIIKINTFLLKIIFIRLSTN